MKHAAAVTLTANGRQHLYTVQVTVCVYFTSDIPEMERLLETPRNIPLKDKGSYSNTSQTASTTEHCKLHYGNSHCRSVVLDYIRL